VVAGVIFAIILGAAAMGASHRMPLMAYAQLSSRLGGGIVLILGSKISSLFANAEKLWTHRMVRDRMI